MNLAALVAWLILWPFARVACTLLDARAGLRWSVRTHVVVGVLDFGVWLFVGLWIGARV